MKNFTVKLLYPNRPSQAHELQFGDSYILTLDYTVDVLPYTPPLSLKRRVEFRMLSPTECEITVVPDNNMSHALRWVADALDTLRKVLP